MLVSGAQLSDSVQSVCVRVFIFFSIMATGYSTRFPVLHSGVLLLSVLYVVVCIH